MRKREYGLEERRRGEWSGEKEKIHDDVLALPSAHFATDVLETNLNDVALACLGHSEIRFCLVHWRFHCDKKG
jgi:hypothetical protein